MMHFRCVWCLIFGIYPVESVIDVLLLFLKNSLVLSFQIMYSVFFSIWDFYYMYIRLLLLSLMLCSGGFCFVFYFFSLFVSD